MYVTPLPRMATRGRVKGRFVSNTSSKRADNLNNVRKSTIITSEKEIDTLGTKIIDLDCFISNLVCHFCVSDLRLQNIVNVINHGIAAEISIRCDICGENTNVPTSSSHYTTRNERKARNYDLNSRLILGMIDTGLGESQINMLLAMLNIPPLTDKMFRTYLNEVGNELEDNAIEDCDAACRAEKLGNTNEDEQKIAVSFDMGWQKRGKANNSLTGVGTLVGAKTNQVIDYEIKNKDCRQCKRSPTKPHNCKKNHTGSSKSMEAKAAVDMFMRAKDKGLQYSILIGDDDSTTLHHIRKNVNYEVKKWTDIQHTKRSMYGQLLNLKKKHHQYTDMVVAYFKRLFSYALSNNINKPDDLAKTLRTITPHAFGDHENCGQWCKFEENPAAYKHKGLPRGKPLTDDSLREALNTLFNNYASNSDRLSPMGSTQKNESINSIISRKAPKTLHFGGSGSLAYRVAAAVSHVNTGRNYLNNVLQRLHIKTGIFTQKYLTKISKKRNLDINRKRTVPFKKRRNNLKLERSSKQCVIETREGTTYESLCDVNDASRDTDITEIPPPEYKPDLKFTVNENIHIDDNNILIIDLETTGLNRHAEIVQIAATTLDMKKDFSQYSLPVNEIELSASKITKLTTHYDNNGRRRLDYNGAWVETVDGVTLVKNFLNWISQISNKNSPVALIGHNANAFDFPVLINFINTVGELPNFLKVVTALGDTLPHFKKEHPDLKCYKQSSLASHFLQNYNGTAEHNAIHDVSTLAKLIKLSDISSLKSSLVTLESFHNRMIFQEMHKPLLISLKQNFRIGSQSCISNAIATKTADSGLGYQHLELVYKRSGATGIKSLLEEKTDNGKPRVTKNKNVIDKFIAHFRNVFPDMHVQALANEQ